MSEASEWDAVRQKALQRDGDECRFCGVSNEQHKTDHGRGLHTHHILPESEGGTDELSNLMMVCGSCHRTIESTQASALAEIKSRDDDEIREELYPEVREELEGEYTEKIDQLTEKVNNLKKDREDDDEDWALVWSDSLWLRLHVVSSSPTFGKQRILTVTDDKDSAIEAYDDADGAYVVLETFDIRLEDFIQDNIRVSTPGQSDQSILFTSSSSEIDRASEQYAVHELSEIDYQNRPDSLKKSSD